MDAESLQLMKKIEDVNLVIDRYVTAIAVNDTAKKDRLYQLFIMQIQEIFPLIMQYYMRPEMKGLESELQEWSGQLARITDAIKGEDLFFLVDVLNFETKENLRYLYNKIEQGC